MLQKFLNLRRTDPTWFWLIVILTLGTIFLIVLIVTLWFYITARKKSRKLQEELDSRPTIKYTYVRRPEDFRTKIHRAFHIEFRVEQPNWTPHKVDFAARKAVRNYDRLNVNYNKPPLGTSMEAMSENYKLKVAMSNIQDDAYKKQIKRIQKQKKVIALHDKSRRLTQQQHTHNRELIKAQDYSLRELKNMKNWNTANINSLKIDIDNVDAVIKKRKARKRHKKPKGPLPTPPSSVVVVDPPGEPEALGEEEEEEGEESNI